MIYLVTGITGFLGPHLAKQLVENGHIVYGLLRGTRGTEQEIRDILTEHIFNKIIFLYGDLIHYCWVFASMTFDDTRYFFHNTWS